MLGYGLILAVKKIRTYGDTELEDISFAMIRILYFVLNILSRKGIPVCLFEQQKCLWHLINVSKCSNHPVTQSESQFLTAVVNLPHFSSKIISLLTHAA